MSNESSSFGKRLSKFIIVISAVGLGLSLWSRGIMDEKSFTILLVLSVIAAVIDSVWVKLIFALAGIAFLLLSLANYDLLEFQKSIVYIGLLLFILFSFYVMVGGMRKRK